jgi:pyruvate-ferredoxin/flavodoxin oxidoreductase
MRKRDDDLELGLIPFHDDMELTQKAHEHPLAKKAKFFFIDADAVAKFAAAGKSQPKKDIGLMAMTYGNVYVARVALCANDGQVLKALREAGTYEGPSIVIAYSHCIAHGYDLVKGLKQQKAAVDSGPLKISVKEYEMQENRFKSLNLTKPEEARKYFEQA